MKKQAFFITGTDTGVGKTYVACKLIQQYVASGYQVIGMKPVAAGEDFVNGEWVNDDVLKLEAASNVKAPRHLINPYSFKQAIAPHIAAELAGVTIDMTVIIKAFNNLAELADIVIVEGAGGLLVPLNQTETMADLALTLKASIIMIVGMRLGCINHALLTVEAIKARQLTLDYWVANQIDENMQFYNNNLAIISHKLQQKPLHQFGYNALK